MSELQTNLQRQKKKTKRIRPQATTRTSAPDAEKERGEKKSFLQERLPQRKQRTEKQEGVLRETSQQRRRLVVALLIVGAVFVLLIGNKLFTQFLRSDDQKQVTNTRSRMSLATVLSGEAYDNYSSTPPDKFEEECFSLKNYSDIRVSSSGNVLGFSVSEPFQEAFRVLVKNLEKKGWVQVASGLDGAASFVKQEGVYVWLYLSCVTLGDSSSVVVQVT